MHENLLQLYQRTNGFHSTPGVLAPNGLENAGRALLGANNRNMARGDIGQGAFFEVYQSKGKPDVWMNVYRGNGTLYERQHYHPTAAAYALTITHFDATGKNPTHYSATAPDGRQVEEIAPNNDHQLERIVHIYPDLKEAISKEVGEYGSGIPCHITLNRFYGDNQGTQITVERYSMGGVCVRHVEYHKDGKQVRAIQDNQRGSNKPARVRTFTDNGLKESEQQFDTFGKTTGYMEYFTENVKSQEEQKKKLDQLYKDGAVQTECHYFSDGVRVNVIFQYDPESRKPVSRTAYTEDGSRFSEHSYDTAGRPTDYVQYYTTEIDDPTCPPAELRQTFKDGIIQTEIGYHRDGVIRFRKDCDADGKHVKLYQGYNVTGEHPVDIQKFQDGKIVKKVLMERKGDMSQVKRILLYDKGEPYRSRERYEGEEGSYWGETEMDRKTGYPVSSVVPRPDGLVRHIFDPNTGKLKTVETHTEPEEGEKRKQATHYYPAYRTTHPEAPVPLLVQKIDHFDEEGEKVTLAESFRKKDRTLKFREWPDKDGKWIRRAYAPGTRHADDDTPFIAETVTGPNGKRERHTLRTSDDPDVTAVHKIYDAAGNPVQVTVETLGGEAKTLPWADFNANKIKERQQLPTAAVQLATIAPLQVQRENAEIYSGSTVITFQGDAAALRKTQSQLIQRFPDIQCELAIGDKQWDQHRGETGHYASAESGASLEKVNVLKAVIPYKKCAGEAWPKSFYEDLEDTDSLQACRGRAQEEATEVLQKIYRYTRCDLRLTITPVLLQYQAKGTPVYEPSVRISWPNEPYLSPVQGNAIRHIVSDNLEKGKFVHRAPDQCNLYCDTNKTTSVRITAENTALRARKALVERLVPAPPQHSQSPN